MNDARERIERAFERESDRLEQMVADGKMTNEELKIEMRELRRDYRDELEGAAQEAYDDVKGGGW